MSDDKVLQGPIEKLRNGDLDGAIAELDDLMSSHKTNAEVHHMYAEFANMKNTEAQDDVIPGGKIMMAYKKAMQMVEARGSTGFESLVALNETCKIDAGELLAKRFLSELEDRNIQPRLIDLLLPVKA